MKIRITFDIKKLPFTLFAEKDGRRILDAALDHGELKVAVLYDYSDIPLCLCCKAAVGDHAEIILMEHRIELHVNGTIRDEEWPAGKRIFEIGDRINASEEYEIGLYREMKEELPSVISAFENAEGWRPVDGVFVGDCMPYRRDEEYHVLYLKDRHHHGSKWGLGAHQWEHISTRDFVTWQIHPMAVPITHPSEGSICTGSWIRKDDREYLYYTVRKGRGLPAPILRSISADGYHFEKDGKFGFTVSEKYQQERARDPKVIRDGEGLFHMFLTTRLVNENKGCLAHYVSEDMETWTESEQPIYVAPDADEPECPDYFEFRGKYYLVFSLQGKARYMISDRPFDGFKMPEDPFIPCESVPKCAEWRDRLIFVGFKRINGYAGTMTFRATTADEKGILMFEPV